MIYYDDAWLKIYDKPVLYFPKFFHPDPTVKRQSGFLIPSLRESNNLGVSLNIPYYNVISNNKDFTLRPRFYSNEGVLLQSEYREINKNSNHILDFSFLKDKNHTKNHFFSKSDIALNLQNFDETELKLQLQHVSNDTYLKTHKLKSPIIGNNNVLTSSLDFQSYRDDLVFSANFHIFEDLSLLNNDRFEFIYPSYTLRKTFDEEIDYDGLLSLNSSGHIKNYNTNVFEKVIINDLLFSTDPLNKSNGLRSNFDFLIKNINTDSNKSKKHKDETSVRFASLLQYNLSFPLLKKTENYTSNLKPLMTIKFSPNKTKNLKDDDVRLDISNIYTIDRIGSADDVEEGTSLTYGFEYMKTDNSNTKIISANIANVLRINESKNLPTQSGLGNKTSDVVGNFSYKPYDIFELEYDYSVDSNLNDINYQLITTNFTVNNFVTSFEYLNENKTNNNLTYLTNKTTYYVDESNNLSFEARENKKTGLTEFYNLIYQYRNDCLIAAIEYNKDYYNDRELKAEENVFFKLSIIPFGETSSANLLK
jgi:LPS-assembly protein